MPTTNPNRQGLKRRVAALEAVMPQDASAIQSTPHDGVARLLTLKFPDGLPEQLEHIGQIIGGKFLQLGMTPSEALAHAIDLCEQIRESVGGSQFYIPKTPHIHLDKRENRIWNAHLKGRSYFEICKAEKLSEVHVRNIVNKARAAYILKHQPKLW